MCDRATSMSTFSIMKASSSAGDLDRHLTYTRTGNVGWKLYGLPSGGDLPFTRSTFSILYRPSWTAKLKKVIMPINCYSRSSLV